MADKKDLDYTYTTIDKIFRLSMGETGDFSGAKYDGNFSLTLEEAQREKHDFIRKNLNIIKDCRVLDMGCGWGPFLNFLKKEIGAKGIGLTLSEGQAKACRKNGLEVYIKDCKTVQPEDFGTFDGAVSLGAFEHFCSFEEYIAGKQEDIYKNFFHTVCELLPAGGRFYLQTMVFSKNMIDYEKIDINAPYGSDSHVLALMIKKFPGSWLPYGSEMIIRNAEPYFKLLYKSSGRLDYIETIGQWRKKLRKFNLKKYWLYLKLLPKIILNKDMRHQLADFRISPNKVCFEREIMDHYRFVFEKV